MSWCAHTRHIAGHSVSRRIDSNMLCYKFFCRLIPQSFHILEMVDNMYKKHICFSLVSLQLFSPHLSMLLWEAYEWNRNWRGSQKVDPILLEIGGGACFLTQTLKVPKRIPSCPCVCAWITYSMYCIRWKPIAMPVFFPVLRSPVHSKHKNKFFFYVSFTNLFGCWVWCRWCNHHCVFTELRVFLHVPIDYWATAKFIQFSEAWIEEVRKQLLMIH